MKVCCISDLHGYLIDIPSCDLLLITGDISVYGHEHNIIFQKSWLDSSFKSWIKNIPANKIVLTFGNHDLIGEKYPEETKRIFNNFPENFTYLECNNVEYNGFNIWGSPYQLPFGHGWAFNAPKEELKKIYSTCEKTDIILSHGPPFKYGDLSPYGNVHTGSKELIDLIDRTKPKLLVCGHIHNSYGIYNRNKTIIINACIVNEECKPINKPIILEI